jgi:hypothetical protein
VGFWARGKQILKQKSSIGEFLGDMQKELPGRTIRKWLAGGPKNYAYIHTKEDGSDQVVVRRIRGFRRHKRGMLYTQSVKKTYKAVFEKGIVIPGDLSTRPFGWIGD